MQNLEKRCIEAQNVNTYFDFVRVKFNTFSCTLNTAVPYLKFITKQQKVSHINPSSSVHSEGAQVGLPVRYLVLVVFYQVSYRLKSAFGAGSVED